MFSSREYLASIKEVSGIFLDAAKLLVQETAEYVDTKLANALNRPEDEL